MQTQSCIVLHIADHVVFIGEEEVKHMWILPIPKSSRGIYVLYQVGISHSIQK